MNLLNKLKKEPWFIAGGIVLLVVAWMLTGIGSDEQPVPQAQKSGEKVMDVRVKQQQAEEIERHVDVYGRTEPARTVTLKAETGGRVVEVPVARGEYAKKGTDLVRLDVRDRQAQLERARAQVTAARLRNEAEQKLQHESFASATRLADARAQFEAAQAELRRIEVDLGQTRIRAPFNGALQEQLIEVGDYVAPGDPVGTFVDVDTLIVTGSVSETERANLEIGSIATARLVTGQEARGRIRFIAPVAEERTRTFRIELEVPNPERALPAGVTAQIEVPAGTAVAHRVSPAILTLNADGEIGIKTVGDDGRVRFNRIEILKSTNNGVWVEGLPREANIITVGQGFVEPGDKVRPVVESDGATPPRAGEVTAAPTEAADE